MIATRKSKFAAVAVAGTVLLGTGTAAVASAATSAPAGGVTHLFVNIDGNSPVTDPILLTGAIGDFGTTTTTTKAGKVNPNGNFQKVKLTKGTFVANITKLNKAVNNAPGTFNASTCSLFISKTRPITLSKGTGLYTGVAGTLRVTESIGLVFPRKANGTCNAGQNVQPIGFAGSVTGVGKVRF
jgi:hypothetical protein